MGPPRGIQIRTLRGESDLALGARFYREVLEPSFHPDELDPWNAFAEGLCSQERPLRVAVAVDGSGTPLGGLTAELFPSSRVLLVGYVAVRPDRRGKGIGTLLMRSVAPQWYDDSAVMLALGEVHDPRHTWPASGEDALARLLFFQRVGTQLLRVPFIQPALGPGLRRVPHFLLAVFAFKEATVVSSEPLAIDSRLVDKFVREYFDYSEGPIADDPDPELAALLAEVSRSAGIAVIPLDRYNEVPGEWSAQ